MTDKVYAAGEHVETLSESSPHDTEKYIYGGDDAVGANLELDEDALPPGYFRSKFFVGTMAGIGLGLMAGVAVRTSNPGCCPS